MKEHRNWRIRAPKDLWLINPEIELREGQDDPSLSAWAWTANAYEGWHKIRYPTPTGVEALNGVSIAEGVPPEVQLQWSDAEMPEGLTEAEQEKWWPPEDSWRDVEAPGE